MVKNKYVTIESSGKLKELGGIMGPITTPTYLDINIIIALINSGKVVYEVNPANITIKTRLTRLNVLKKIYGQPENSATMPKVNASDVKLNTVTVEPSVVKTTVQEVVDDIEEGDAFIANYRS